jgi:integrase
MANALESKTKRAKLAPKHGVYWHRLRLGVHIGYRKSSDADGTWMAKVETRGQRYQRSFGTLLDAEHSAYEQARRLTEAWVDSIEKGVTPNVKTVKDACDHHIAMIRADKDKGEKAADDALARLQRLVYQDPLANLPLSALTKPQIEAWRMRAAAIPALVTRHKSKKLEVVTRPRSSGTMNRDIVPLRAALNRALANGQISSNLAWQAALKPAGKAARRRTLYLNATQRLALLDHADAEISPFLQALASLPLRPGGIAHLTVSDFNAELKSLRIGKDKTGGERWITLPKKMIALLSAQAEGRAAAAPLLPRSGNRPWDKDSWKGPIKDAAVAAKLPAGTTAYTLRHSVITDLVVSNLDLLTIAQISGTSVAMIEQHYGHLQQNRAAAALEQIGL